MKERRTLEEIMSEKYRCPCGWQGEHRERIWARAAGDVKPVRGYICPQCYEATTERVETEGKGDERNNYS